MLMAIFIRGSGMMVRLMERAHLLIRVAVFMKENGRMICNMVRLMSNGIMDDFSL